MSPDRCQLLFISDLPDICGKLIDIPGKMHQLVKLDTNYTVN
jgi:hypothetical protein